MSLDRIYIRDLQLRCIIGIYPEEREKIQDVVVNMTLEGSFAEAALTDDIKNAANYKTITKKTIAMVENSDFFLIEKLAEKITEICFEDPVVQRVTVSVDKPGALRFARSVAVEITRDRPQAG